MPPMIRRTYSCTNCDQVFTFECNANDGDPVCPNPDCDKVLDWRPQKLTIGGSIEGKAAAETYRTLETDYGLSNFKDNAKQGESGIVKHTETKVETEKVNQVMSEIMQQTAGAEQSRKAFWGDNAGPATNMSSVTGQQMIAMAKAMNRGSDAVDPIAALHSMARKAGVSKHPASLIREGFRSTMNNPARKDGGS